jgi:hypothetical protein
MNFMEKTVKKLPVKYKTPFIPWEILN